MNSNLIFAIETGMELWEWFLAVFAGLSFIIMFILVSIKGDYKGVIESSLEISKNKNESLRR